MCVCVCTLRYVVCEPGRKLAILARLLRKDLEDQGDNPLQPARAMVFANSVEVRR